MFDVNKYLDEVEYALNSKKDFYNDLVVCEPAKNEVEVEPEVKPLTLTEVMDLPEWLTEEVGDERDY